MKNFLGLTLAAILLSSQGALADCRENYSQAILVTRSAGQSAKVAAVNTAATVGTAAGILAASGAFAIGGLVLVGSGAVVSAVKIYIQKRKLHGIQNTLKLINEAYDGKGPRLDAFASKLSKRSLVVTAPDVANWIALANENNVFCPANEYNEVHLFSEKQIFKTLEKAVRSH